MRLAAIGWALCALTLGCGDAAAPPAAEPAGETRRFDPADGEDRPPVVESVRIEPREPAPGDVVRAVVAARDPEGRPMTLAYRWSLGGVDRGGNVATLDLSGAHKNDEVSVSVVASDGVHESPPAGASVTVIDRLPQIAAIVVKPPATVAPGQPVSIHASADDPDGDAVDFEYVWFVNGEKRDVDGSVFETDGLAQGDRIGAEVRATDGAHWTPPRRIVEVVVGSAHPEITSNPPGFREDGVFEYQVEATDPDGDRRLRYALAEAPDGMVIDAIYGQLRWKPNPDQSGVFPVKVVVRDSSGLETTQAFSVTVEQTVTEAPPAARRRR